MILNDKEMPLLRPLPIYTKNGNWFKMMGRWLFKIRKWRLEADWYYSLPTEKTIIIRKGFEFDGASVPRFFWGILAPTGLLLVPGLLHDYGYRFDKLDCVDGSTYGEGSGRRFWDRLFLETALDQNGFKIINRIAYGALRLFGWTAWNFWRKQS